MQQPTALNSKFTMAKVKNLIENGKENAENRNNNSLTVNELSRSTYAEFLSASTKVLTEMEFEKQTDGNLKIKCPSDTIFNALPELLKTGVDTLKGQIDKEVFLYGALGCLSAIMPNVFGVYNGRKVYTNVFVYILGSAGSGKGALEYGRRLVLPVHLRRQELTEPQQSLILAANTSSTKAVKDLSDNGGDALFFETEGDTMANAFKSDTGDHSDTFRKAFHHEPISLSRVTDNLKIYISEPRLSAVLSSTFGQLLSLVPSAENGLFSRFLFHEVQPTDEFVNPFDRQKRTYESVFDNLGNKFFDMYEDLRQREAVNFDLHPNHEEFFVMAFSKWKREIRDLISERYDFGQYDLDGTIHRLGLICFRLAMIFTTIRRFETNTLASEMICSDEDFYTAFRLVEIAKNNAFAIYTRLPKPKYYGSEGKNEALTKAVNKADSIQKAKELHDGGMSLGNIAAQVLGDPKKKQTISNWLKTI